MRHMIVLLLAVVVLASCGQPGVPSVSKNVQVLAAEAPRATPEAPAAALSTLVAGMNRFATDLYSTADDGNLIFSPYSIALAFSMAYAGAEGETAEQMRSVLGFLPPDEHHMAFNALDQRMQSLGTQAEQQREPFQLNIANSTWGQRGYPFDEAYLQTLARFYGAALHTFDFETEAEAARATINAWADHQTKGKIKEVVPAGMLDEDTRLVLANAIYFKAQWVDQFDEAATQDGPFTLLDGRSVTVPLMHGMMDGRAFSGDGYVAGYLPYAGGSVDMLVIVPESGRFAEVEGRLRDGLLSEIATGAQAARLRVIMPRFEFDSELQLKEMLCTLGLELPFSDYADFSGMIQPRAAILKIDEALHKATITVDEEGTEAAAVTVIELVPTGELTQPVELRADKPFLFAIVERETGALLFLGRVVDPSMELAG